MIGWIELSSEREAARDSLVLLGSKRLDLGPLLGLRNPCHALCVVLQNRAKPGCDGNLSLGHVHELLRNIHATRFLCVDERVDRLPFQGDVDSVMRFMCRRIISRPIFLERASASTLSVFIDTTRSNRFFTREDGAPP